MSSYLEVTVHVKVSKWTSFDALDGQWKFAFDKYVLSVSEIGRVYDKTVAECKDIARARLYGEAVLEF